jgi:hypothetical protein
VPRGALLWLLGPLLFGLSAASAYGQAFLTRGPYLQSGTPSSVVVRWRTSALTDSRVRYGTELGHLDAVADLAGHRSEHEVKLAGLRPDTRYYYAVGSSAEILAGGDARYSFVTAPAPGTAKPTRVWVLGDSGTANRDALAVRNAYLAFTGARPTDLWLMLGDNAYVTGTDAEYQAAVFDMYPAMLRQSVLWPTIGNHDAFNPGTYFRIFTLPAAGEAGGIASGTESYYSFDYGRIHFICLDSQISDRAPGGAMLTWLRSDLQQNTLPWVIAFWHHPPYSKGTHDSDVELNLVEMRQNANPILEAGGVDLVLTGHSHGYERSFLLDGHYGSSSTLTPGMIRDGGDGRPEGNGAYQKEPGPHEGAVYAVAGSSGQTGPVAHHPAMYIGLSALGSLVLDVDHGAGGAGVDGGRLDATFLRSDGTVADRFTILKDSGAPPATTVTFSSVAAQDGRTWEASAGSGTGGGTVANEGGKSALRAGDRRGDRQYRSIVSFDTSSLPDGATVVAAKLRLVRGTVVGTDPFTTHGRCRVDVRRGVFGGSRALVAGDFAAAATVAGAGTLSRPAGDGDVAEAELDAAALAAIHKAGTTQLRIAFERDHDGDAAEDYVGFFAGEDPAAQRPQLIVTYR